MKKYSLGFLAISLAIVSFSFSTKFAEGPDCQSSYTWFKVKPSVKKTSCASILRTEFEDVLDPNQNGIVDAGEVTSLISAGDLELGNGSIFPFGCPDVPTFVCALSYDLATNPIAVIKNASNQWIFVPSTPSQYKCCVKRPQ